MGKFLIFVIAAAIAIGRIFITPRLTGIPTIEGGYESFSHLIVGFMIIVPWYDRDQKLGPSKIYGRIGWALGIWELGWFLFQKFG
jgi:hypothetical protein